MSGSKILITGLANSGKTSLLKPLKNAFVVSRDGKPFSLELPHFNVPDYKSVSELVEMIASKLEAYEAKFGKSPDTICFDSVSRIFTDIENICSNKFKGFEVWANVNKEINQFLELISQLQEAGYNIILIAHCTWDEKASKYIETCKGSFAKIGGFLGTVDYAINIDVVGKSRIITHRGTNLSRTLITELPDKQDVKEFNLQTYLETVANQATKAEKWSL